MTLSSISIGAGSAVNVLIIDISQIVKDKIMIEVFNINNLNISLVFYYIKKKISIKIMNYFIFVFNERYDEDESELGIIFKFPVPDRGSYKILGKTPGSWGSIIKDVAINDRVLWTISGSSKRKDKKTFWGFSRIIDINEKDKYWILESSEFDVKIRLDDIIGKIPDDYKKLYLLKNNQINVGRYRTIKIDEFQYLFFLKHIKQISSSI